MATCEVSPSNPVVNIQWKFNGLGGWHRLATTVGDTLSDLSSRSAVLLTDRDDDDTNVTCEVYYYGFSVSGQSQLMENLTQQITVSITGKH